MGDRFRRWRVGVRWDIYRVISRFVTRWVHPMWYPDADPDPEGWSRTGYDAWGDAAFLSAGSRITLEPHWPFPDLWYAMGKSEYQQPHGSWANWVELAEAILDHPNTAVLKAREDEAR